MVENTTFLGEWVDHNTNDTLIITVDELKFKSTSCCTYRYTIECLGSNNYRIVGIPDTSTGGVVFLATFHIAKNGLLVTSWRNDGGTLETLRTFKRIGKLCLPEKFLGEWEQIEGAAGSNYLRVTAEEISFQRDGKSYKIEQVRDNTCRAVLDGASFEVTFNIDEQGLLCSSWRNRNVDVYNFKHAAKSLVDAKFLGEWEQTVGKDKFVVTANEITFVYDKGGETKYRISHYKENIYRAIYDKTGAAFYVTFNINENGHFCTTWSEKLGFAICIYTFKRPEVMKPTAAYSGFPIRKEVTTVTEVKSIIGSWECGEDKLVITEKEVIFTENNKERKFYLSQVATPDYMNVTHFLSAGYGPNYYVSFVLTEDGCLRYCCYGYHGDHDRTYKRVVPNMDQFVGEWTDGETGLTITAQDIIFDAASKYRVSPPTLNFAAFTANGIVGTVTQGIAFYFTLSIKDGCLYYSTYGTTTNRRYYRVGATVNKPFVSCHKNPFVGSWKQTDGTDDMVITEDTVVFSPNTAYKLTYLPKTGTYQAKGLDTDTRGLTFIVSMEFENDCLNTTWWNSISAGHIKKTFKRVEKSIQVEDLSAWLAGVQYLKDKYPSNELPTPTSDIDVTTQVAPAQELPSPKMAVTFTVSGSKIFGTLFLLFTLSYFGYSANQPFSLWLVATIATAILSGIGFTFNSRRDSHDNSR